VCKVSSVYRPVSSVRGMEEGERDLEDLNPDSKPIPVLSRRDVLAGVHV
jgi:hypothetical protein